VVKSIWKPIAIYRIGYNICTLFFYCTIYIVDCEPASYVASYYNVPIFVESGSDPAMDNKTVYNTLIRLSGSIDAFARAFVSVFKQNGWSEFFLLSDMNSNYCQYGASSLNSLVTGSSNMSISEWVFLKSLPTKSDMSYYISRIQQTGRS